MLQVVKKATPLMSIIKRLHFRWVLRAEVFAVEVGSRDPSLHRLKMVDEVTAVAYKVV